MKKTYSLSLSKVKAAIMEKYYTIKNIVSIKDIRHDDKNKVFTVDTLVILNNGKQGIISGVFTKDGILVKKVS